MAAAAEASTDQLEKAAVNAIAQHKAEAAIALQLYQRRITQAVVENTVDAIFDDIFTDERAKAQLLPYFAKRTARHAATAQELAHIHDVVRKTFQPILTKANDQARTLTSALAETLTQHIELEVLPALQRAANSIVVADRHAMSDRLHQRVEFIQSEALSRLTMIANHEARELNEHITATLLGRRSQQQHANKQPGTKGGTPVPGPDELPLILAECARRLKPETLQRMSTEECKEALLQSYKREASAWATVEELQRRLDGQEAGEEERRLKFEQKTRADAETAVQRAEGEAAAIQSELNKLRVERAEMQDAIIEGTALIVKLDARCALMSAKLSSLIASARVGSTSLPPDFAKAERELLKLSRHGIDDLCAAPAAPLSETERSEIRSKALASLKTLKLKSDQETIPPAEVSDQHRVFAENVMEMASLKQRLAEAQARAAHTDKVLRAQHQQHLEELAAVRAEMRDQERRFSASLKVAVDDKLRIMDIATKLHMKLQEATIQVHVAGDEVVEDLVRRLTMLSRAAGGGSTPRAVSSAAASSASHQRPADVGAGEGSHQPDATAGTAAVPVEQAAKQEGEEASVPTPLPTATLSKPPTGRPSTARSTLSTAAAGVASSRPSSARVVSYTGLELKDEWLADLAAVSVKPSSMAAEQQQRQRPASAFIPKSRYQLGIYRNSDADTNGAAAAATSSSSPRATPRPHSAVSPRAQQLRAALLAKGGLVPKPPSMRTY